MTEPYLILHKVRGQPAFDIAHRMPCPICEGARQGLDDFSLFHCDSCMDTDGYWWVLSACGYRAYPWWWTEIHLLSMRDEEQGNMLDADNYPMPSDAQDCFTCNDRPLREEAYEVKAKAAGLLQSLGLIRKIERRI